MEGFGKIYFSNGDFYVGDFKNNKINGRGKYLSKASGETYDGQFIDN